MNTEQQHQDLEKLTKSKLWKLVKENFESTYKNDSIGWKTPKSDMLQYYIDQSNKIEELELKRGKNTNIAELIESLDLQ